VDKHGKWVGKRLVEEQTPARKAWREVMESQHPASETPGLIKKNRVFGLIAVGGGKQKSTTVERLPYNPLELTAFAHIAFGDIMYKVPVEHQTAVLPNIPADIYHRFARYHHRIIANYQTPPYLYSKPIVTHHEMQENDRFIVIATDGLWWFTGKEDEHSADGDQAVADIMSRWKGNEEDEEVNPATHLMKNSFVQRRIYDFANEHPKGNFDMI
jgi:pyruvate dehydrogenase phosphatase